MKPAQDLTGESIRHRNSPNDSGNEARPIVGLRKRAAGGESAGDAAVACSSVSSVSTYGHCRLLVHNAARHRTNETIVIAGVVTH